MSEPPTEDWVWVCIDDTQVFLCDSRGDANLVRFGEGRYNARIKRVARERYQAWWEGQLDAGQL